MLFDEITSQERRDQACNRAEARSMSDGPNSCTVALCLGTVFWAMTLLVAFAVLRLLQML